jgi:hypothetical protein
MISHLNLQQLKDKLEFNKHQLKVYENNLATADADNKHYWKSNIQSSLKIIQEIEDTILARSRSPYYDIKIADLYKGSWLSPVYGGGPKVSLYTGEVIGVELEFEGENLHCNPVNYWKTNSEHSLREYKGHPPVEYALIKPLLREGVTKALDYLDKKFKTNNANPVISPRTSTHIHLNAQGMTWKQIVTWFVTYALVEDILVEFSGKERIGNLFCLRTRDTHYFVSCLESAIKSESYSLVTNMDYRYTSMNLASIEKFGSVEFRSMRSPIPFEEINDWIDVLIAIKQASLTWKNPSEVVKFFETYGPDQTLKRIFPETWMFELFNHSNLKEIMWEAIREVKDVAYACDWSSEKKKQTAPEDAVEVGIAYTTHWAGGAPGHTVMAHSLAVELDDLD